MSRKRFEQLPEDRQAKILEVAARRFAKDGFGGTSYNELLAEAGLGKSSAYYYFADKEDLFLTVVQGCYRRFFESIGDLPEPSTPAAFWEVVTEATERGMRFMRQDPTAAALMQGFVREQSALSVLASSAVLSTVEGYYVRMMGAGRALGVIRKDIPEKLLLHVAQSVSAAFDQWFILHGQEATPAQLRKLAAQSTDMMRRLLEPSPATAPAKSKRAKAMKR